MTRANELNGATARYERDGFLYPLTAMTPEEAHGYRRRIDSFRAANPTGRPFREIVKSKSHLLCLALLEIVRRPEILDAVEVVLGPEILCWSTGLFLKEANDPAYVSWHQDATYWGLEPQDIVTAWLALSPATVESGAMRFVPGSHVGGLLPHADTRAEHNMLARGQVVQNSVDDEAAVSVLLQPGQFSLHHGRLVHGSAPNRSSHPRYGVAVRYIASHVRPVASTADSALLVRGKDSHGHFKADAIPVNDYEPWALALSAEVHKFAAGH